MTAPVGPVPGDAVPPSVLAAQRAGGRSRHERRAYPVATASRDPEALAVELAATQALVRAQSAAEVGAVVSTLVHDLGGALVPARYADPGTAVPVDISLGLSEPLLPFADPISVTAMRLTEVLPEFLEDARLVLDRLHEEESTRSPLAPPVDDDPASQT